MISRRNFMKAMVGTAIVGPKLFAQQEDQREHASVYVGAADKNVGIYGWNNDGKFTQLTTGRTDNEGNLALTFKHYDKPHQMYVTDMAASGLIPTMTETDIGAVIELYQDDAQILTQENRRVGVDLCAITDSVHERYVGFVDLGGSNARGKSKKGPRNFRVSENETWGQPWELRYHNNDCSEVVQLRWGTEEEENPLQEDRRYASDGKVADLQPGAVLYVVSTNNPTNIHAQNFDGRVLVVRENGYEPISSVKSEDISTE